MNFKHASALSGNDSTNLTTPVKAFTVGVAGNVKVDTTGGETTTIPAIAGFTYYVSAKKLYATGTTATGIIGYW